MDRKDALEFLELPDFATEEEIKVRLEDKLAYFERLSEKAPSDFLRKLHAKNVIKIKDIQKGYKKWKHYQPELQPEPAWEAEHSKEPVYPGGAGLPRQSGLPMKSDLPKPADRQVPGDIQAAAMPGSVVPKPEVAETDTPKVEVTKAEFKETDTPKADVSQVEVPQVEVPKAKTPKTEVPRTEITNADIPKTDTPKNSTDIPIAAKKLETTGSPAVLTGKKEEPAPAAWLVRHTENQSATTFPLYPGKNYLGRKQKPGLTQFIVVEEDPYISKVHAVLFVEQEGPYRIFLADDALSNGDKESKNGTYLNGDNNRISGKTELKENDTIQLGVTKLILRHNNASIKKMVEEVEERDYMHTVVIDIA